MRDDERELLASLRAAEQERDLQRKRADEAQDDLIRMSEHLIIADDMLDRATRDPRWWSALSDVQDHLSRAASRARTRRSDP